MMDAQFIRDAEEDSYLPAFPAGPFPHTASICRPPPGLGPPGLVPASFAPPGLEAGVPGVPPGPWPSRPVRKTFPGSFGHPFLCNRPCVHMMRAGFCSQGPACGYCHEDHSSQSVKKLDKQQRKLMQQMPPKDLLELLLPHIHQQIANAGIADEATDLLRLLTRTCRNDAKQTGAAVLKPKMVRELDRALAKLPLLALVRFCPHDDALDDLELLLGQMRCEIQLKSAMATGLAINL
mmetsp:Transcript_58738/g.110019  ORF Transcript_58738/g.110019 Transcript_58738/m.110019 type:complete len:236 (+) Transcript_58738:30-737(+)